MEESLQEILQELGITLDQLTPEQQQALQKAINLGTPEGEAQAQAILEEVLVGLKEAPTSTPASTPQVDPSSVSDDELAQSLGLGGEAPVPAPQDPMAAPAPTPQDLTAPPSPPQDPMAALMGGGQPPQEQEAPLPPDTSGTLEVLTSFSLQRREQPYRWRLQHPGRDTMLNRFLQPLLLQSRYPTEG